MAAAASAAAAQTAAAAALFGAQHPLGAQQPVDPTALQLWVQEVEGRLDAQAMRVNGVGLQLEQTIGHAKEDMQAIVSGVSAELVGFQRQVHHDHGKMNAVVGQIQLKFAEIEAVMQSVSQDFVA